MTEHEVVVAGGGPTGMMLAGELALAGVDVVVVERRVDQHTVAQLLAMDEARRTIAAMITALDIRYDLGDGHPLVGHRMPDLDLQTTAGPTRVYELLHDARPVLLDRTGAGGFDVAPWGGRIRLVDARHDGAWELPVVGEVPIPEAVAIRPDGHVCWAGSLTDPELPRSLAHWFGAPAPT